MDIPNDEFGGKESWIVEVHHTGWLADLLGAHGLGPWPESFQAQHPCRDCWWHSSCWCAHLPEGHKELRSKRPHAEGCRGKEVPRSLQELKNDLQELRSTVFRTKKDAADAFCAKGVARVHCTLDHLGNDMSTDAAADISHLFLLGVSRHEIFWMLEDMTKGKNAPFTYDQLNVERKKLNAMLPSAHKVRLIERPNTDGKSMHQVNMNMTAAEVMHFALNSVAMIGPLLNAKERQRTSWISWIAHVRLLSFCLRYVYVQSDGEVLIRLVNDFLTKFIDAYGKQYHKPKHHMLKHLVKYWRCNRMRTQAPAAMF